MTGISDSRDDWIASSMLPGSDGLYFLGTFERRITFYSQQVRAFRLIKALHEKGTLKTTDAIAVIGGGAAGVTSALALAILDYNVTLFDPADEVLQLQSASPRLLHPHIYEWPSIGSLDKSAGLPFLDWNLGSGGEVAAQLVAEFRSYNARLQNFIVMPRARLVELERDDTDWRLKFADGTKRVVQKVILAVGFGDEMRVGAAPVYDYWKERGIGTAAVESNPPAKYLVSGNGDGALTDILNLMIKDFEHVSFTEKFLSYFDKDILRTAVLEAYAALNVGVNLEPAFEEQLLKILVERGILDLLKPQLRRDRDITISSSGHLLSVGKAAQLNQCMVFVVLHAAKQAGIVVRRGSGKITDVVKDLDGLQPVGIMLGDTMLSEHFEHVILRHGPNKRARYQLAKAQFADFETVSTERFEAHPELLVPPTLDAETYTFFFDLWMQKLADAARKQQLLGQTTREASTIIITWDAAIGGLVQRGKVVLEDIITQCETAAAPIIVQLEVPPDRLNDAEDLVRLGNASGGKITFTVGETVRTAWSAELPNAPVATSASSRYPYRKISDIKISEHVDASLLRQLDSVLANTRVVGKCSTLGKIAPDVLIAALSTWAVWRADLEASPLLRRDFLAWLGSIGPKSAKQWNGNLAALEQMASALVLMLATHLGEPLQPSSAPRSNLSFDVRGQALGSAAVKVDDGSLLTDWDQPDHWDVDALILSGSSEVSVMEPDDTIINGGDPGTGLEVARRIKPAIVRNDERWRIALRTDLPAWKNAVEDEFRLWRNRQNDNRDRVLR